MNQPPLDLVLPYLTEGLEGIGGRIRAHTEDFIVEEVSQYKPSGHGSHLYVNITKKNVTTREVQLKLAEIFDLRPQNIGFSGLKDKFAVTTQTFSILFEGKDMQAKTVVERIRGRMNLKVNWAKFHDRKLRVNHLTGNRFRILVTDIRIPKRQAYERSIGIAEMIHQKGLPNYYGHQRVGKDGKNVCEGWAILQGQKWFKDRWLRGILVSAYSSYLCNRYLAERMRRGFFDRLIPGDIVHNHKTGEQYWVKDITSDQMRYDSKEVSFTAPMYGYKMSKARGESASLEEEIFEESGMSNKKFKRLNVIGTRRIGRLTPKINVSEAKRGIELSFMLHKGGYATTLLREFMKNKQGF